MRLAALILALLAGAFAFAHGIAEQHLLSTGLAMAIALLAGAGVGIEIHAAIARRRQHRRAAPFTRINRPRSHR